MAQIDLKNTKFFIIDGADHSIEIMVGEGSLNYTEVREINMVKDRGELDKVREGEEQSMPVDFEFIWEYITADIGDPPSIEDVLKKRGEAADWVSVSTDPDDPYCVTLQILNEPECTEALPELITLREFHYSDLAHDPSNGTIAVKGMCNDSQALVTRVTE